MLAFVVTVLALADAPTQVGKLRGYWNWLVGQLGLTANGGRWVLLFLAIAVGLLAWDVPSRLWTLMRTQKWLEPCLTIVSALYGLGEGQYRDVTAIVQAQVVNGRLHMQVENEKIAKDNPFRGKRKHLVLVYSLRGPVKHTVTIGEHGWVDLPTGSEPH